MSSVSQLTFLLLSAYAVAVVLTSGLAAFCFFRRSTRVANAFGGCMVAVLLWSVGASGRLLAPTEAIWYTWTLVMYVGVVTTAVLLLVFAALYTGHESLLTPARVGALFVLPATSMVLLATDPTHQLFFEAVREVPFGAGTAYTTVSGPWFWVHAAYSYVLLGIATALLARFAVGNHRVYRRQSAAVLAGAIIPWLVNVAYLFSLGVDLPVDPTPVGFAVGGCLLAYAVFGVGLTDVTPVARSRVVDAIEDAVFVVDRDGRLVDLNPAAAALVEDGHDPVGSPISSLLPDALLDPDDEAEPVTLDGTERWYSVREISLDGAGSVLLVSEVTEQMRRRRQVLEQNRRLEEFTRVAAHDLRNPLNAISGYVELARETGDLSFLEQVDPAAERMETLVEDLLTLGREGRVVEETEPVELSEVVGAAWRHVDAEGVDIELVDDATVMADEPRLEQLLENLFRNCAEHSRGGRPGDGTDECDGDGGEPVTVRVGTIPDGFYVADDGTGVPTERRADVFEYGYSTHGGTGLGLPVVRSIAVAHGWEVSVTEGRDGGARFEFAGVDVSTSFRRGGRAGGEGTAEARDDVDPGSGPDDGRRSTDARRSRGAGRADASGRADRAGPRDRAGRSDGR